ncbi:outer membrane lipoprotein carrier protein LolA [Pseudoxanthomonas dokdonensis]|uniref:Outer membrane lipoprotein carrier protein LolA n=1 Tax=Pseudoxanthomonas dokdonensis TaxID=344882 RepID=A0A0R0D0M9_9GAMM|nr:outer membrane lipoprotein carrier protein LolA [Pseudoxanthomonas dokdonensis]KRG71155.1 hypothetical protein ABB29_04950 [Pseudoxanthomonas dokdonensis]
MSLSTRVFAALLWLGLAGPALASGADNPVAVDLQQVQQRIAQVAVLKGNFSQRKQVSGFSQALRSQGHFLLARDKGVIWTTTEPFASEMVVTPDQIFTRRADGSRQLEVYARQQPALRSINDLVFALVAGDVSQLSSRFEVQARLGQGNAWELRLTPRAARLKQVFRSIALSGDRHVRSVLLEEAGGDSTAIEFSDMDDSQQALDADEAARFE